MCTVMALYDFKPGSSSCGRCQSKTGTYSSPPARPHKNCKCKIAAHTGCCDKVSESTSEYFQGTFEQVVAVISEGGSATVSTTKSRRSSTKWEAGVEVGGVGGGVGGESGESESNTQSNTFNHSGDCNGSEKVIAVYSQYKLLTLRHWECVFIEFWESEEEYVSRLESFDQRCAS